MHLGRSCHRQRHGHRSRDRQGGGDTAARPDDSSALRRCAPGDGDRAAAPRRRAGARADWRRRTLRAVRRKFVSAWGRFVASSVHRQRRGLAESGGGEGATRHAADRTSGEAIRRAWGVTESADGAILAYYRQPEDAFARNVVVEAGVSTTLIAGPIVKHELSPDGQSIAVYRLNDDNSATLVVVDLASGEERLLATDIDPCSCDSTRGPLWSPSAEYVAYIDYGEPPSDETDRGSYVVAAVGGNPVEVGLIGGWLADGGVDRLVVSRSGVARLYAPATGAQRVIALEDARVAGAALLGEGLLLKVSFEDDTTSGVAVVDPLAGFELERWAWDGDVAMTPAGPAIAVSSHEHRRPLAADGCPGVWLDHPALAEPTCFAEAEFGVWAPDGPLLALRGQRGEPANHWIEIWSPADGIRYHFDVPRDAIIVDSSPDGQRVLVTWGVGI